MALNASDIVSGLRLAIQLYDYGFTHENAADVRYNNFRNDIFNFRYLLEKLDEALENAQQRYHGAARLTRIHAYDPLSDDFENERKILVGNFVGTLKACDKLLEENNRFRQQYSNVFENLKWHLTQQERRVDDLRTRLHFHSEKIRLVMDRLSINLLTDLDEKVDDLLAISGQNLYVSNEILHELLKFRSTLFGHLSGRRVPLSPEVEVSHQVSDSISSKFHEYLAIDAPPGVQFGMPMSEGFDVLYLSFEESTRSSDCTPESYLSFLKTRWLLECLTAGEEYRTARPGFYYKRAVNQISQAVIARMQQPGVLISYDDSILTALSEMHFRIWPPSEPAPVVQQSEPHPLMIRAGEEEVVQMRLASLGSNGTDTVTVFKRSEELFRIVLETMHASRPDERILVPKPVNVRKDKLIPRYALPTIQDLKPEIAIYSLDDEEVFYRFDTFEDLFRFQTALTGYDVSHDQPGIRCQFSDSASHLDCKGRVQLWQEPIVLRDTHERNGGPDSLRAPSSLSDGVHSRIDSLAASMATSNTIMRAPDGWEAESLKLPAIAIFTELTDAKNRKRFAIIFLALEIGTYVDPTECKCSGQYDTCSKLVLTSGNKQGMAVRALFSDVGHAAHSGFDLLPFRTPRHPDFRKLAMLRTKYLVLKFARLEEKRLFDQELNFRFQVRDKQLQKQYNFTEHMRRLETQRPLRQQPFTPPRPHERSLSDAPSTVSLPPRIELTDTNPRLDSSFLRGIASDESLTSRDSGIASLRTSPRTNSTSTSPTPPDIGAQEPSASFSSRQMALAQPTYAAAQLLQAAPTAGSSRARPSPDRLAPSDVAPATAAGSSLQTDISTERRRTGRRDGFWRTFKF